MAETILVVDEKSTERKALESFLAGLGFEVICANSALEAEKAFAAYQPDLSIIEFHLSDGAGTEIIKVFQNTNPAHPVLVVSEKASPEQAVQAMKSGAFDYLGKPINFEKLRILVEKALEVARRESHLSIYSSEKQQEFGLGKIIGDCPAMKEVSRTVEAVARIPNSTVLITGESGTGKELIAHAIHYHSDQRDQPFVEVNCSAMPETLLEAELFGYEKGAFTDAKSRKKGLLEIAEGGTFFLDEIGEMTQNLQVKILKAIEERRFRRIGGIQDVKVNLRIITATNANLEDLIAKGLFRKDLYYRLNVLSIQIPPLRNRGVDILLLTRHYINHFNREYKKNIRGLTPECERLLLSYNWPGNVRELRNAIERAVLIESTDRIRAEDLHLLNSLARETNKSSPIEPSEANHLVIPEDGIGLEEVEKHLIKYAMKRCGGNVCRAARFLKISRETLRYRLKKYSDSFNKARMYSVK
jgi:two-component system response regulator AtoC